MTTAASPNFGATWHVVSLFPVVSLLAFKLHGAGPDEANQDFQKGYEYHTAEGEAQDLGKALQYYRRAIKADPTLFPALSNAALIYYARRDYKKARHFFSEAINAARGDSEISSAQIAKSYSDLGGATFKRAM